MISASKYISIGTTMARGSKNKPEALKTPMYRAQIKQAHEMFVILYDTSSLRGWLVDGASALVHIVRTQLVKEPYKDSLSFQISDFHHPKDDSGPDAAKEALLDRENQRLFVLEELDSFSRALNTPIPNLPGLTTDNEPGDVQKSKTSDLKEKTKIWSFKDLVSQTWSALDHIRDRHVAELASPTLLELKMPLQHVLEGFEFMDIVRARPLINPREIPFKSNGKAWWKFAREIQAVTLFGKILEKY